MAGDKETATGQAGRQPPLWLQLQQAAQVVQAVVQQGRSAPAALETVPAALRPGVQALVYRALRRWGMARWLRAQLAHKAPPALADALLGTALALAWQGSESVPGQDGAAESACRNTNGAGRQATAKGVMEASQAMPYNAFTLVNQTVEAARRHPRMRHQAGMLNACLRNFLRAQQQWQMRCQQASPGHDPALLNLPAWWLQRLRADHPADAAAIALAGQKQASMHLRVNARRMTPAEYLQKHLLPAGIAGQLHGTHGILLHKPCAVQQLPGFEQGWVSVQDAAAQLAAPLLLQALHAAQAENDAACRWRLLDACAAPGGKTAHLLEMGEHAVTALEIDAVRCERIAATLQRLNLHARIVRADAGKPQDWWDGEAFDGILLDAPCSASGIVRRHPDIAWLRREQDIAQLAQTQRHLLQALWPLLRPGGVLLYATCSVFRAEGQAQIDTFLSRHKDALLLPAPGHLLPKQIAQNALLGQNDPLSGLDSEWNRSAHESGSANTLAADATQLLDHDGFYYALLAKNV